MIILYYTSSNSACRKALAWFKNHNIEVLKKRVDCISQTDLIHILTLTENGFREILKRADSSSRESQVKIARILSMSFNESIEFIQKNTDVLKAPLILEKSKILIGFDKEKIRIFIPQVQRQVIMKKKYKTNIYK